MDMTETEQDWRHRAECRDADPELFQPEVASQEQLEDAMATYCAVCPVRAECTQLARSQPGGVYGIHGGRWWGPPPRDPAAEHCTWCGEPLEAERSTATYCSSRCRVASHRERHAVSA